MVTNLAVAYGNLGGFFVCGVKRNKECVLLAKQNCVQTQCAHHCVSVTNHIKSAFGTQLSTLPMGTQLSAQFFRTQLCTRSARTQLALITFVRNYAQYLGASFVSPCYTHKVLENELTFGH